jgi:hypothetical protein
MSSKAMFQLQQRLKCSYPTSNRPNPACTEDLGVETDQEIEVTEDDCNGKPGGGNQRPRACFSHRRTHNDELCMASCGVILGRTTFYGSEAPSAVLVCPMQHSLLCLSLHYTQDFLMELFPTQKSLPGVIWYDNNCNLVSMLQKDSDPQLHAYFKGCALPVDVFH